MPYHKKHVVIGHDQDDLVEIMSWDQLFGPTATNPTVEKLPDGDSFVAFLGAGPNGYTTLFLATEPGMGHKSISLHKADGTQLHRIDSEGGSTSEMTRWSGANTGGLSYIIFWKAKMLTQVRPMYVCTPNVLGLGHDKSLTLKWHTDS